MPNRSKQKGDRGERQVVDMLNEVAGFYAQRVPLSGAAGGEFSGDVKIFHGTYGFGTPEYVAEVKVRAKGFTNLYGWLEKNDFLFIKQDRERQLVVMDWETFRSLLEAKYDTSQEEDHYIASRDSGDNTTFTDN